MESLSIGKYWALSNRACVRVRNGTRNRFQTVCMNNLRIDMGWTGTIHGCPPGGWCVIIRNYGACVSLREKPENLRLEF